MGLFHFGDLAMSRQGRGECISLFLICIFLELCRGEAIVDYVIEMLDIHKSFAGVVANDRINLQIKKGEIHALLGENGAGKSTLMNILFGLYRPDSGEIKIRGKKVKINNPKAASQLGIGMVHQHFMLISDFTVTENLILGMEPSKYGFLNKQKAIKEIERISKRYKLHVDPYAKIENITVGMQQRVEILKVLYRGAEVIIFDEPTAVLMPQEISELIQIMKRLAAEGKSIILITHKLKEIQAAADRVTVIRDGKSIQTVAVHQVTADELAALMTGRQIKLQMNHKPANPKKTVLQIRDLVVSKHNYKHPSLHQLNLEVRQGEIVGIAGVDGNGQSELVEVITGMLKPDSGQILLNGVDMIKKKTREITKLGVGHIPQDRLKYGLVPDFTVEENMILQCYDTSPYSRYGVINSKVITEKTKELIHSFHIRTPSTTIPVRTLSGGNQQKITIARELDRNPDLVIAVQPTRGLDIGAIAFVYQELLQVRDAGKAVLLVSLELEEIRQLSDRIAVIFEGQIVDMLDARSVDEQYLGLLMAGGKRL